MMRRLAALFGAKWRCTNATAHNIYQLIFDPFNTISISAIAWKWCLLCHYKMFIHHWVMEWSFGPQLIVYLCLNSPKLDVSSVWDISMLCSSLEELWVKYVLMIQTALLKHPEPQWCPTDLCPLKHILEQPYVGWNYFQNVLAMLWDFIPLVVIEDLANKYSKRTVFPVLLFIADFSTSLSSECNYDVRNDTLEKFV